jgi:hypothetical protein
LLNNARTLAAFAGSTTPTNNATTATNVAVKLHTRAVGEHYAFVDYAPLGTNSLVGWWRGEDDAEDDSSYGHDGTWSGTAAYADGRFGRAFDFNVTPFNFVSVSTSNMSHQAGTISAWFRRDSVNGTTDNYILSARPVTAGRYYLYTRGSAIRIGLGDTLIVMELGTVTNGLWYHGAMTWENSGSNVVGYLNGGIISTASSPVAVDPSNWAIGNYILNPQSIYTFDGAIDDVTIWNRALSAAEISALYDAQLSQYTNSITLPVGANSATGYAVNSDAVKATTETRTWTTE